RPVSNVLGIVIMVTLTWTAVNGVLFQALIRMADGTFQNLDALIEADVTRPLDPLKAGSPASLLSWEGLGRAGRAYSVSGPSAEEISTFTGRKALEPLRVYVGL